MKKFVMTIKTGKTIGLWTFLLLLAGSFSAVEIRAEDRQDRLADHMYRLRALEALYDSQNGSVASGSRTPELNPVLARITAQPLFVENTILPFTDSARIARRIDDLLSELERTVDSERAQVVQFNLAYEYFLFYLSFLNQKHLLEFRKDTDDDRQVAIHELVTSRELSLYLLQSQLYLQPLIRLPKSFGEGQDGDLLQKDRMVRRAGGTSFMVRENPSLYLNAVFVAFMIECEKLAGRNFLVSDGDPEGVFDAGRPDIQVLHYLAETTWFWMDILWQRYRREADRSSASGIQRRVGGAEPRSRASYVPSAQSLYTLYQTYLTYHFMWRYIVDVSTNSPFFNTLTRVIFERLDSLQQDAGLARSVYYRHYLSDAARDGGQTNFLPALFFARRGYAVADLLHENIATEVDDTLSSVLLFDLYGTLYDRAASRIQNNIPFRSRIYSELVLFGIRLNDLRLMEEKLYPYAEKALRIARADDHIGNELAGSPRLTTAYLLARILENKNSSGLYQGTERYRDMAEALAPLFIAEDNNNWHYASTIHYALAKFFSRENHRHFNESLAMYHARQAFLAPCEKVATTYGQDQWHMFFSLEPQDKARDCLALFLYFHNKYATNPEAVIPRVFNAEKIIEYRLQQD